MTKTETHKRQTNDKKNFYLLIGVLVPFLLFLAYGFWYISVEERVLEKERVEGIATVIDVYSSSRGTWVKFEFSVGLETYQNSMKYLNSYGNLKKGDRFKIVYAENNPTINRVIRNKDKTLIKIRNN